MRFGPIEFGAAGLGFSFVPTFFSYQNVQYDDDQNADEAGIFWLGFRLSFYYNVRSWKETQSFNNSGK